MAAVTEEYTASCWRSTGTLAAMLLDRTVFDMEEAMLISMYKELVFKRGLEPQDFEFSCSGTGRYLNMKARRL